jgi:hypothetical protein
MNIVTRMRNAIRSTGEDASQNAITIYNDPRIDGIRRLKAQFGYRVGRDMDPVKLKAMREAVEKEFGDEMVKMDTDYRLCVFVKVA